ncbi:regulator of nonsense transcripts 3B [Scaptodrosophila lebanonensis]|uniref:Regulator of nonsense transcripts 3B n=1 Tax=Drosophila lebanonensis TaxID=7225 RepID=A0A6J2TJZ9_DROLE|nr:regulator of nonsense transcripts 3B [Scaptodrosophila lebanonensis]
MSENIKDEAEKCNNSDKPKVNKRRDRKDRGNNNHSIKIVVRHLPPTMTEEEFLEQVDPLPENNSFHYCPADWTLAQDATCRAYISMKNNADVLQFRDRFDSYVFVDSKGEEYVAIVEYAPFQRFAKNKAKPDNKVNTIECESHFQEFIQKLTEERDEASRLGEVPIDFNFKTEETVKSTPLLQYLANKKEKRREEARKRSEEKRKQREEQKQQRENAKDVDAENKKPSGSGNSKKGAVKDSQGTQEEQTKSSRAKRRSERDQRRREEHEQRKLMRDKGDRNDRVDKEKLGKSSKQNKNANKDRQKASKEITILKKENKTEIKPAASENPDNTNEAKSTDDGVQETIEKSTVKDSNETGDVNETVKDFIKAAVSSKETNEPSMEAPSVTEKKSKKPEKTGNKESSKSASQRAYEERRIRNKDRPSIAIYQPKARLRLGSEDTGSPSCSKDATLKSDPQRTAGSDGESSLPDDQPTKKNKRHGRRNRSKHSDATDNVEHERQISKSSESSTSANSKIS